MACNKRVGRGTVTYRCDLEDNGHDGPCVSREVPRSVTERTAWEEGARQPVPPTPDPDEPDVPYIEPQTFAERQGEEPRRHPQEIERERAEARQAAIEAANEAAARKAVEDSVEGALDAAVADAPVPVFTVPRVEDAYSAVEMRAVIENEMASIDGIIIRLLAMRESLAAALDPAPDDGT